VGDHLHLRRHTADLFGNSVAISGNTIIVGAPTAAVEAAGLGSSVAIGGNAVAAGAPFWYTGAIRTGAIYLFVRPATGWSNMTEIFKRIAPGVGHPNYPGWSAAFGGNTTVVAGAPRSSNFTGAAYIFERMP
jgi:hypothetical protein